MADYTLTLSESEIVHIKEMIIDPPTVNCTTCYSIIRRLDLLPSPAKEETAHQPKYYRDFLMEIDTASRKLRAEIAVQMDRVKAVERRLDEL